MPPKKRRSAKKKTAHPIKRLLLKLLILACLCVVGWIVYLDFKVRAQFDGDKWAIPARVYSQPLELYEGLALSQADLIREFKALGYDAVKKVTRPGQVASASNRVHFYTKGFNYWDQQERPYQGIVRFQNNRIVSLQANGALLARIEPREIGSIYPLHGEDRVLAQLENIPPLLGEALIAVEDKNFAHHYGFSPKGIARAFITNLKAGQVVQGGSTLTQQLVKNFYLTQRRSLWRKVQEVVMALLLEFHYTKADILEAYINEVYLGQSGPRAIHGFGLAASFYFNRPLSELAPSQIALLVGVVKGATYYNPWRHPERATARRNTVLKILYESQLLDEPTYRQAMSEPLTIVASNSRSRSQYPAYLDLVKRQLLKDYQAEDLQREGLKIFTTLSPRIQRLAEQAVAQRLKQFDSSGDNNLQAAAIITRVGSGEVLALVGDRKATVSGFNRALDARRQIGSLVKPFVYLTALQQSDRYNLSTPLDDSPLNAILDNGDVWAPRNFSLESHESPWLLHALSFSYNQSTARLGLNVGVDNVINNLQQAGLTTQPDALPSLLLGALSLSPLDVSHLYHTLAADGVYTPLRAIKSVLDAEGNALKRYPLKSETRFNSEHSHLIHYGLQSVMRIGTGRSAYASLPNDLMVAGKTGTTNDQRDSWFAGYSAEHLGVVWVGNDDNQPTRLTGSQGALKIWTDVFKQLNTQSLSQNTPSGIEYYWLDSSNGFRTVENCENAVLVPFIRGTEPTQNSRCTSPQSTIRNWFRKLF